MEVANEFKMSSLKMSKCRQINSFYIWTFVSKYRYLCLYLDIKIMKNQQSIIMLALCNYH